MLITFQSQAAGDVMMFGAVAKQMLMIIGKDATDRGIVTVAQLADAIAALKSAIAADKAVWPEDSPAGTPDGDVAADRGSGLFVSTSQRAHPLLELFEWSLKADQPVLWVTSESNVQPYGSASPADRR